jgi:hypothetical protein
MWAMRTSTLLVVIIAACGPSAHVGNGNGGDGGSNGGGDDSGTVGMTYMDAPIDEQCGAQMQNIGVVSLGDPPDLLVVLDRSGSMIDPPITFPPVFDSKWDLMRDALVSVTTMKDQNIRFGMLEFPSDDNCSADAVPEVAIALGTHPAFSSYFASRSPNGNTPAFIGLADAQAYFGTIPVNPAGRYVLFATDGLPNCSGGDPNTASSTETVAAVTALKTAGIKTFVLGFGTFGLNTGVLNDAADAGGEAKTGLTHFYEANNATDLAAALQAISGGIIVPSCKFALQSAPPNPGDVTVTVNGMVVPQNSSHTDGWDYYPDAMTITFFGSYCATIMGGASTDVKFVYGCQGPIQ